MDTLSEIRAVLRGPFRILAAGRFLNAIGNGMTLSLLVVYLSQVRGIPIFTASLVLAWMAVIGLVATPLVGTFTDRFGPRPVLLVALAVQAVGVALLSQVSTLGAAFAVASLMALGGAGIWGPDSTFTARLVSADMRTTAFAIGFMLLNLGLGLGGLIGAAIIDISRPETFVVLYLVDAATFGFSWIAVVSLRGLGGPSPQAHEPEQDEPERGGWATAISDGRLRRLVAVSLLLVVCGYGSLEAGMAIFITDTAGLPASAIGLVWLSNTLTIVVGQLFVLRLLRGRSRTRLIGVVGLLWGASWLILAVVPEIPRTPAFIMLLVSTAVFAIGETVWSPTAPALVNAFAPDHLRGRYNSAQSLTWNLGTMVAPLASGLLIGAGLGALWAVIVGIGCILAGLAAQTLRRMLTPAEDGRSDSHSLPLPQAHRPHHDGDSTEDED